MQPDADTAALFEFEGNAHDSSASGRHAALIGGNFIVGRFGRALQVGVGSQANGIDWSAHAGLLRHPFTVEFVFTPDAANAWGKLFGANDDVDNGWYLKNGGFQAYPAAVLGANSIGPGRIVHIAVVSAGGGLGDIFIQGVKAGRTTLQFAEPATGAIFFRDDSRTGRGEQARATIEAIRVSSRARSDAELLKTAQAIAAAAPTIAAAPAPTSSSPVPSRSTVKPPALHRAAYRIGLGSRLGPVVGQPVDAPTPSVAWDRRKGWSVPPGFNVSHEWFIYEPLGLLLYVYSSGYISKEMTTSPMRLYSTYSDPLAITRGTCRANGQGNQGCVAFNHQFSLKPGVEGFVSVTEGYDPKFARQVAIVHVDWNDPYRQLGPVLLPDQRQDRRLYGFTGGYQIAACVGGLWGFKALGGRGDHGLVWREASAPDCRFSDDQAMVEDFSRARALTLQAALLAANETILRKVYLPEVCQDTIRTWRGSEISRSRTCYPGSEWWEWSQVPSLRSVDSTFAAPPPQ